MQGFPPRDEGMHERQSLSGSCDGPGAEVMNKVAPPPDAHILLGDTDR